MHEELDRLRELLKQRILVGKPGGGFFMVPKLSDESSRYLVRDESEEEEQEKRRRHRPRRAQASLGDFEAS